MAAVGDHELDVGGLAGGDHALAVFGGGGHGFFAEDVLARFGSADGELSVLAVGQDDVDDLDFGVPGELVVGSVVVEGGLLDAVLGGDLAGFFAVAGDEGYGFAVFGLAEGGKDLAEGEAAKAYDGEAGALGGGLEGAGDFFGLLGGGVDLRELDGVLLVWLGLLGGEGWGEGEGGGCAEEVAAGVFGAHARLGCGGEERGMPLLEGTDVRDGSRDVAAETGERTSAAKAEVQNRIHGTAEAVPLSATYFAAALWNQR